MQGEIDPTEEHLVFRTWTSTALYVASTVALPIVLLNLLISKISGTCAYPTHVTDVLVLGPGAQYQHEINWCCVQWLAWDATKPNPSPCR
jgi:hypothetical protein